jgi:hypothetical protein
MITPTLLVQVWKGSKTRSVYGETTLVRAADEKVAPVRLDFDIQHTTVRTDSSSSHGHAEEMTAAVTILARPQTKIAFGDMLVIQGRKVRVLQMHTRYTTYGQPDHVEIRCTAWVQRTPAER